MQQSSQPATRELLDLSGETVLVTGASGNIGAAIAERLAEAGASIIAHYNRNEAAASALVGRLGGGVTEVILGARMLACRVPPTAQNMHPRVLFSERLDHFLADA